MRNSRHLAGRTTKAILARLALGAAVSALAAIAWAAPVTSPAPAAADDWPAFHQNAARTGNADGKAGPETPSLRWKFRDADGAAAILSSPAVSGGRLFVGSDNATLYCLDADTGTLNWRAAMDWELFCSPVVAAGRVYVGEGLHGTEQTTFRCLAADTGQEVWSKSIPSHVEGGPCVAGGRVYVGAGDAGIWCLDAATGSNRWQFTGRHVDSAPAVVGNRLYATVRYGKPEVLAWNAGSGRLLWESPCANRAWGVPTVRSNRLWFGGGNGNWEQSASNPAGEVACLDTVTGKRVWSTKIGDAVVGSVTLAGQLVVFGARDGHLRALDATRGTPRWSKWMQPPILSTPVAARGFIYVGADDGQVRAFEAADGRQLWTWNFDQLTRIFPAKLASSPALAAGRLYAAASNGFVVCLEEKPASNVEP